MAVLVFEHIKGDDRIDCIVRYGNRDLYTKSLIADGVKYSFCVVSLMEILKFISLVFFLGLPIMTSKTLHFYLLLDVIMNFLFYFRAIVIYLFCKAKSSNRNISIIITLVIYFLEYVIFYYVFYETELLPAYALMIPFTAVFQGINPVLTVVWLCASLILDILLTLMLLIAMRGKDILSFEK